MKSLKTYVFAFAYLIALAAIVAALSASSETSAPVPISNLPISREFLLCPQTPRFHEFGFHCRNRIHTRLSAT
jgi:hypothetical protein